MIIKRKYELIGELIKRDSESKQIIMDALLTHFDKNNSEKVLTADADSYLYIKDMSLCIPNLEDVLNKLDEIDRTKPYDNGLTYRDVTKSEVFSDKSGDAIEVWLISAKTERPNRIVQIIALKNGREGTQFIDPWYEMFLV
jgi:hypothetical protein